MTKSSLRKSRWSKDSYLSPSDIKYLAERGTETFNIWPARDKEMKNTNLFTYQLLASTFSLQKKQNFF